MRSSFYLSIRPAIPLRSSIQERSLLRVPFRFYFNPRLLRRSTDLSTVYYVDN